MSGAKGPKVPYWLTFRTVSGSCSLHHSSFTIATDAQTAFFGASSIAPWEQEIVFYNVSHSDS